MKMDIKHHSLSEVQNIISEAIRGNISQNLWIIAEIAEIKINYSGHCYLELIEKKDGGTEISAKIRGIIWSRQARFILSYFESTTGSQLEEGMKILIKATVEYNKLYGLSLIISDIDPTFTLGELAIKKAKILKRLEDEGVIEMNRELAFPLFPQRVAIISSKNAAGLSDFTDHITNNSHAYSYSLTLFPATMQGKETSQSVSSALNQIYEQINKFDLVAIVRGGGSQSDLSWFDDYDIAFLISQFPIPVLTGIGHEKDVSVTDIVAYSNLKTPTAVADYIIDKTLQAESYLERVGRTITDASGKKILELHSVIDRSIASIKPLTTSITMAAHERISHNIARITPLSRIILINSQNRISSLRKEIIPASRRLIENNRSLLSSYEARSKEQVEKFIHDKMEKIGYFEKSINILSPDSVLKRGYTITTLNGVIIKDINQVKRGDKVISTISNGSIESEIFDIKE